MIQDIFPHRFNNHYQANREMGSSDFVLHYQGNTLLLKVQGEEFELPRRSDFPEINDQTERIFLFTIDEVPCFLVWEGPKPDEDQIRYQELSFFRTTKQREIAFVALVGFHLMSWYAQNRFCGKCGSRARHKPDERAMICPVCGSMVFPKISPAIIVAIVCRDKILLARNSNFAGGWYSLVAGYADVGETLEETVAREVKEEVGLDVCNIRYYKSQPWALSGSLMIGFVAEADDRQPIAIDGVEIADAAWFSRGNLPNHPTNISIAGEMIAKFERGEL